MLEVISYLRVSGKGQLDGDGFERQRDAIGRFAKSAGYTVVDEFREEAVSGTTELEDRPALMAALARLASNGVRVILIERADRLARDAFVQESIIRQAIRVRARIVTADGDDLTDDENPSRKLTRQIFGAIAEFEKRCLVLKLSAARTRIRQKVGRCEGRKPFGARDGEAEILQRARRLRDRGTTFAEIAEKLNAAGLTNRQGKPWKAAYVHYVLKEVKAERIGA